MSRKDNIRAMLSVLRGEIAANAANGGRFASGLAGEGFAGGYYHALCDVLLVLDGVAPSGRYDREWSEAMRPKRSKKSPLPAESIGAPIGE